MTELRFTQSHEWISVEDGIATVGITRYAADQLGDVVFVELPAVGKIFAAGAEAGVVESVKAASEIYAPLAGEVTEVNESLAPIRRRELRSRREGMVLSRAACESLVCCRSDDKRSVY
jgi:glycine cleavage system H protein